MAYDLQQRGFKGIEHGRSFTGWYIGAVDDTQYKKGHVILIGIACQARAQAHGTYKFLLNSLLYPGME